jgi:phenylalanyl-tRNA synthetase beta chain
MEYSLSTLTQNSKANNLKTSEIINQLNLIGFEVDNIFTEKSLENIFLDNVRLLIKIPANREDLLNERFFLNELSTILLFNLNNLWDKTKINYSFILKENYLKYYHYQNFQIQTKNISNTLVFTIELQNFKKVSSPLWVQKKLVNFGFKPEKNLNDFLNLASLEWGQTFSFYSTSSVPFLIEKLNKVEKFIDIKQISYDLSPGTIVVKNKNNEILNVLGLINSTRQIDSNLTSKMFLEATFYNEIFPTNQFISPIFEHKNFLRSLRKIFLENFKYSFQRLLTLLELNSAPEIIPKLYSVCDNTIELKGQKLLKCRKLTLKNILNLSQIDISIFEKNGLKITCQTPFAFYFSIPTYRKDLEREIDLIEEYSKLVGYENFSEIFPKKEKINFEQNLKQYQLIKQFFINSGFNEVLTNPIVDSRKQQSNSIFLNNPLNNDFLILRTNIFLKLIDIFEKNLNLGFEQNNFFEIGRTFKKTKNFIIEIDKLAGIFQLERIKKSRFSNMEWFLAKGFIENFLALFNYKNIKIEKNRFSSNIFHETKSIVFKDENKIIGIFGEVNPALENFKITKYPVYLFEFNLSFFNSWRLKNKIQMYEEYSKYPAIIKDLSFSVKKDINFSFLKERIAQLSNLINRVEFFDIYFDEKISKDVNIAIRLQFQSFLQTFTNEQIEEEINLIKEKLSKEFSIQFR